MLVSKLSKVHLLFTVIVWLYYSHCIEFRAHLKSLKLQLRWSQSHRQWFAAWYPTLIFEIRTLFSSGRNASGCSAFSAILCLKFGSELLLPCSWFRMLFEPNASQLRERVVWTWESLDGSRLTKVAQCEDRSLSSWQCQPFKSWGDFSAINAIDGLTCRLRVNPFVNWESFARQNSGRFRSNCLG